MSTTNVQLQITGRQQQATCADEEQHGRTKADQHHHHQQQQQQQQHCSRRRVVGVAASSTAAATAVASRSPVENSSQGRRCARCGGAFGRFYNTGASCPRCRHRVCRQCREFRGSATANNKGDNGVDWLCAVCHKIAELHAATGEWIYETATFTSDRLVGTKKNSPVDILKRSIRRAWTINGPPARWSVARKSPAFRIYRSLPVRDKIYPSADEVDTEEENFSLPQANDTVASNDDDNSLVSHWSNVEKSAEGDKCKGNDVADDDCREQTVLGNKELSGDSCETESSTRNERIDEKKLLQHLEIVAASEQSRTIKNERETTVDGGSEIIAPRVSLIKPPRVIAKIVTPEIKQGIKHGDRKSNIPIFRRSSREFEDIGSPQESAKRSLIPQRYRGSTDDLRRSREDISVPSLIPKLFSPRSRDQEKLKRHDSKDDVRQQLPKGNRREAKDASREDSRLGNLSSAYTRDEQKSGIRIFRRDSNSNSREDVGRETTSLPSLSVTRVKQTYKDDNKHERTSELARVGDTVSRSKSCPSEQGKTASKTLTREDSGDTAAIETKVIENLRQSSRKENCPFDESSNEHEPIVDTEKMANEKTMIDERLDSPDLKTISSCEENSKIADKDNEEKEEEEDIVNSRVSSTEHLEVTIEPIDPIIKNKDISVEAANCNETDFAGAIVGERKLLADTVYLKRVDDMQIVRRKFSKEEFSNPDDTDETPNRRSSSHLSPEASPLSTRSSRYSPRESESEPTPALPRKTGGGDSCTASQRIRDAITRTRRESNSSARYESSGSESVRLSESGLHGYADLARRVKLFGHGGNSPGPSPGSDEPVQRDSATSAGEDEPHEDCHSRGPGSSQGRTMLRRRRQFDAQGSRRRGRSHARSCCGEELQNLQSIHVIGRGGGGRQPSPPQCQDTPNPDYRRLVFISSDSSSGREEDDADSSCSGSSYLNGLPRNNHHAQGLEDCDWDYFESGTLPLPSGIADATTNVGHVGLDPSCLPQDWSCCPGRGSAACLACGGSPGANVLPVPVPIPVPVPYPVPVPASLWTGDFAAAASSMITRGATPEGTLRLRGDPSAPWFSWHPRFNQPLHGARIDPRSTIGAFDPSSFGFRPEEITPRFYGNPAVEEESLDTTLVVPPTEPAVVSVDPTVHFDDTKDADAVPEKSTEPEVCEPRDAENVNESIVEASNNDTPAPEPEIVPEVEESPADENEENVETTADSNNSEAEESNDDTEDSSQESSSSRENNRMYRHSRENSGSSSGRSSADSSDLEDSATHRFSRVFVVNDDSLTSDNDIEDNEDSDSAREGGGVVTLKRVTSLPEEEPVVLRRVRHLDEDMNLQREPGDPDNQLERSAERRPNRIERRIDLLAERDPDANEIYLASSTDFSENHIQLKSIKNLNPDSIEMSGYRQLTENGNDLDNSPKNWDSVITPDSLEVVGTSCLDNSIENLEKNNLDVQANGSNSRDSKIDPSIVLKIDNSPATRQDKRVLLSSFVDTASNVVESSEMNDPVAESSTSRSSNVLANSSSCSTMDSSETNTTGSEFSSDELHEYEVLPYTNGIPVESSTPRNDKKVTNLSSTKHQLTPMPRRILRLENPSEPFVVAPTKDAAQLPCVAPRTLKTLEAPKELGDETNAENKSIESNDTSSRNVGELISSKIHDIFKNVESIDAVKVNDDDDCPDNSSGGRVDSASSRIVDNDSGGDGDGCGGAVRGEKPGVSQVGVSDEVVVGSSGGGNGSSSGGSDGESTERGKATARFRSVERRPPTRKENGCFPSTASSSSATSSSSSLSNEQNSESQNFSPNNSNKYRSLVMITQGAYQPVSVITSDTTTLLQPPNDTQSSQGLAGYFHLALEAVSEPHQRNGQGPRRPLMVKRLGAVSTEQEADSGLSVGGSASESDDVQSVKSFTKISAQQQQQQQQCGDQQSVPKTSAERSSLSNNNNVNSNEQQQQQQQVSRVRVANSSSQSSDDNSVGSGVVILEEGLADDDSWVEEVSHDEDEQSATTATEESSEDEANNLGDREEELRGYHRQAIDFTLHTIVEESCEESEAEPSLATGTPRKKQRPPSASELEKYFFFGLGGDNSGASMGSREVDSLSETSSIYSEGLESLGQEEASPTAGTESCNKGSNEFLNSSRLEKYFLSEFLGFDQDRRDSDGSVGSDSEGRPSPEAQRRKRLVRARGTGRSSHSSSLDNLLALAQGSQNLSSQNSLQDLSLAQDSQETQSEGSSTETDGAEDGQTPAFGTDGQFDTVKRKKKKPRTLGTQSPRVAEDRNKTPEPRDLISELPENEGETINSEDDRAKTPQPESALHSSSSSSSQIDGARGGSQASSSDTGSNRSKQQSRDSGFVGSCDDLLQHQKSSNDGQSHEGNGDATKDHSRSERRGIHGIDAEKKRSGKSELLQSSANLQPPPNASLSRKDSFNNWSSDEETNLMMSKMRQFFKTMVANTNGAVPASNSSGPSPAPSPRLSGYSKARLCSQNRTKPPQLVYFENELTRLMKTVPGIRDEQVREIVEYLSSEDTWSDSYDSSDYTSSDLEGAAGGRRSALQEQISQSCQQIINKFDTNSADTLIAEKGREERVSPSTPQPCLGRDTAFVYQKLVQSFTKIAGDGPSSDANSTPHSSPPLIAKVMHHIGSRLVALMHEVSEGGSTVQPHSTWRRYSQHHRTPSSASTTEDDDSTSDSTNAPSSSHLPRSKSHDPLLLINGHPATTSGQEGEEREASDYERFSWRGSFESALMAADSRTKLSLLACSGDVSASASASALAMAAKRRSAGDLLFNPKSFSREQLDRVRSCGSIGGGSGGGGGGVSGAGGSIEEKIWSNRRRSSVPDANTRGESGASAGDDDTEDELEYGSDPRATTLPRGMQAAAAASAATNSLPRLPASTAPGGGAAVTSTTPMHKAHSVYHFLPQHTGVKSARYRPPGFARNSLGNAGGTGGPKRAVSAPGLQVTGSQVQSGKRETSRSRRQQTISLTPDDGSSLSEACSTPIIGAGTRAGSSHTVMDIDDMDRGLHSGHLATRASLSSLGARSDSMASVYSGAGEGRWCGSVAVRGEVEFSLQYDYKQLTFEVHVTQCKDLAPVDIKRNRSDPYVKVYLLPDKSKSGKRKTKVKKHTLNPVFDETLKFHMSLNGLETRTLWLTVWHSDMFGRNDFLGEVRMPLENKIFDDPTPRWYPLQERTEPFDDPISYKGEVIVGLKFVPPDPAQLERDRETSIEQRGISKGRKNWSRGSLHVLVKEARNLQTRAKNSGTCDPFCKSYLLPDKGRSGKQKTGVVRRSGGSPVWGHTFVYKDVSLQELAERGLELTVWDHDRIASNEFLGGVRFNLGNGKHYGKVVDWMDATGRELSLWQSMIERPNFWVEGAVTLRPNLHNHGKSGGA